MIGKGLGGKKTKGLASVARKDSGDQSSVHLLNLHADPSVLGASRLHAGAPRGQVTRALKGPALKNPSGP